MVESSGGKADTFISGLGKGREAFHAEVTAFCLQIGERTPEDFLRRFTELDREKIAAEALERLSLYRAELPMKREAERNIAECPPLFAAA